MMDLEGQKKLGIVVFDSAQSHHACKGGPEKGAVAGEYAAVDPHHQQAARCVQRDRRLDHFPSSARCGGESKCWEELGTKSNHHNNSSNPNNPNNPSVQHKKLKSFLRRF